MSRRLKVAKRFVQDHPLRYRGSAVQCPICDGQFRRFMPQGGRRDALCPNPSCMTVERHRILWLYLSGEREVGTRRIRVLHIAPEMGLVRRIRALPDVEHVGVDLESPFADVHADVSELPFEDSGFDLVICSHVLEHVTDDARALRELRRMLRPDGTALLMYPVDTSRATTFEDGNITDPERRAEFFGQFDHVRLYGRDHLDRLETAGFEVSRLRYDETLTASERRRFGLEHPEGSGPVEMNTLFLCRNRSEA